MIIQGDSILSDAINIRGFFITDTIAIERTMDTLLASYFCKTRKLQRELQEFFLSTERIPFEMKRQVFKIIVMKISPDFEKKYKDFFPYMVHIMEQRNIFAHYNIDLSKEAEKRYPKEIGFVKYRNETKTIWYNENQLTQHLKKHTYCINILADLAQNGI